MAVVGEPDITEKQKKDHKAAGRTFKVHLDGYNLLPYLTSRAKGKHLRARSFSTSVTTACWSASVTEKVPVTPLQWKASSVAGTFTSGSCESAAPIQTAPTRARVHDTHRAAHPPSPALAVHPFGVQRHTHKTFASKYLRDPGEIAFHEKAARYGKVVATLDGVWGEMD